MFVLYSRRGTPRTSLHVTSPVSVTHVHRPPLLVYRNERIASFGTGVADDSQSFYSGTGVFARHFFRWCTVQASEQSVQRFDPQFVTLAVQLFEIGIRACIETCQVV